MGISSYSFKEFLTKIDCVSSWEAVFIAHEELTAVQRILLKEKAITDAEREKMSFYAKRLKNYVLCSRAALNSRTMLSRTNTMVLKEHIEGETKMCLPIP